MFNIITADVARAISNHHTDEKELIRIIDIRIKEEALDGKRKLIYQYDIPVEDKGLPKWCEIKQTLQYTFEALGYGTKIILDDACTAIIFELTW